MSPYREPSEYTAFAAMDSDVAAILGVSPAELKVDLSGLAADAGRRRSAGRIVVALAVTPLAVMAALAIFRPLDREAQAPQAPQAVALTALPSEASIAVVAKALGEPAKALEAPPPAASVQPPIAAPSAPTRIVRASAPRSSQIRARTPERAVERRYAQADAIRPTTPPSPAPRPAADPGDGRSFEDFAGGRASYPRFATRAYEG